MGQSCHLSLQILIIRLFAVDSVLPGSRGIEGGRGGPLSWLRFHGWSTLPETECKREHIGRHCGHHRKLSLLQLLFQLNFLRQSDISSEFAQRVCF